MQFEENLGLSFAIRVELGVKADRGESAASHTGRLSEKQYLSSGRGWFILRCPYPRKRILELAGCADIRLVICSF